MKIYIYIFQQKNLLYFYVYRAREAPMLIKTYSKKNTMKKKESTYRDL